MIFYRILCFDESPPHAATEKEVDPERRVYDAKLSLNSVPRYCVTEGGDGYVSLCIKITLQFIIRFQLTAFL
jgi:hypothetical protein